MAQNINQAGGGGSIPWWSNQRFWGQTLWHLAADSKPWWARVDGQGGGGERFLEPTLPER